MIALIAEMLGCLILAAGIGGVVGWLLRHLTAAQLAQQLTDSKTELRVKGQALDTALYELKLNAETLHQLESKVSSLESIGRSTQQDLVSRQGRIRTLQDEVATHVRRISDLEAEHVVFLQRLSQQDATMAAFANEARQANAARTAAQQDLLLKEQELVDVRQRLAESDGQRTELDQETACRSSGRAPYPRRRGPRRLQAHRPCRSTQFADRAVQIGSETGEGRSQKDSWHRTGS